MGDTTNADISVAEQSISFVVGEILDGIVEEAVACVSFPRDTVLISTPVVPVGESIRKDKFMNLEDATPKVQVSCLPRSPISCVAPLNTPSDDTTLSITTKRISSEEDREAEDIDAAVRDIVIDIVDKAVASAYQKRQLLAQARGAEDSIAEALESSARRAAERDVPVVVISSDDDDDDEDEDQDPKKGVRTEIKKKRRNNLGGGGGGRDFAQMLMRFSRPRQDYGRGQADTPFITSRKSSYTTGSRDLLSTLSYHRHRGEEYSDQNQERDQEQDTDIVPSIQRRRDRGLGIDFATHAFPRIRKRRYDRSSPSPPPDPEQVIDLTTDSEPEQEEGSQPTTSTAPTAPAAPERAVKKKRKGKTVPATESAPSHGPIGRIALAAVAASKRGGKRWKY